MNKILVTGVNGFVGHHVAQQFDAKGISVIGVGNQKAVEPDVSQYISDYICCDLTNPEEVTLLDLSNVVAVVSLAGFAKVGESRGQGELYNKVNIGVHTVLYDEFIRQKVYPRVIAVSTGAVYNPSQPLPITEESMLIEDANTNEYVISKKLMEKALAKYRSTELRCIIARPFNHTGPGQLPGFLLPDLYEQITLSAENNTPLMVGNLDTKRDFTDVRDVAKAYVDLALCDETKLHNDVFNICSGKSISGKDILGLMSSSLGVDNLQIEIDPSKIRKNEVMDIYGSRELLTKTTDWEPQISIEETVADFIAWRKST